MKINQTAIDDGGSAFPVPSGTSAPYVGITKRDFFAAAVMTGLASNIGQGMSMNYNRVLFANIAYEQADAMLVARAIGEKART